MFRILQGDVGSGKTLVAAQAALDTISAGYQVAFMAPTELLAEQHYANLEAWFTPLEQPVAWLSGRTKGKIRQAVLQQLASGEAGLVVGTHALFQEDVQFNRLGLIIVDEQHRFGVHQRLALREKGVGGTLAPHQLIMTATPIPRTLAMSAYADLDVRGDSSSLPSSPLTSRNSNTAFASFSVMAAFTALHATVNSSLSSIPVPFGSAREKMRIVSCCESK